MQTKQQRQIRLYEKLADSYEERYAPPFAKIFQAYRIEDLLRELSHVPFATRVLDLGCGTGVMLPALTKRFQSVWGLDLSYEMLRKARKKPFARLMVGDAVGLPLKPGCLDAVVCRGALHHAPSMAKVIAEVWRVLKPGGMIVLSEPCNDSVLVRFARKVFYKFSWRFDDTDVGFRSRELAETLKCSGFSDVRFRRFGLFAYILAGFPDMLGVLRHVSGSGSLTRFLIRIDRFLTRIPGIRVQAFHVILSAKKVSLEL